MRKLTIIGPGRLGKTISALLSIPHKLIGRDQTIPESDLYYLTVPDRNIHEVLPHLPKKSIVLHASGVLPHTVLRPHAIAGVLHPLMTFPGPNVKIPSGTIPASISGDPLARIEAQWLADQIGFQTFHYSGNRSQYHCAAVLAGNCGALLLHLAGQIMAKETDMTIEEAQQNLLPLVLESIQNTAQFGISKSLTGPIVRGDMQTILRHREELLSFDSHILRSYNALIESLTSTYAEQKLNKSI
jgi:predicted short-subunit dehydrogenase-like oxidoreductase (DUF2520 family)